MRSLTTVIWWKKGLRNYWGYNSIGFFAPEPRYLRTPFANEAKEAVNQFHAHGIEAILALLYTTPPKVTNWARRFPSTELITQSITGGCPMRSAITSMTLA